MKVLTSAGPVLAVLVLAVFPAVGSAVETTDDDATEILISEDFEDVFPRLPWRVSHPENAADVDWGRSTHRSVSTRNSIYCAGMGSQAPGDGGPAPANTASWAIVGPFDLSEATAGSLEFGLWLKTEPYRDVFMWLASVDGQTFNGGARSTDTNGWQRMVIDLAAWGSAGSVLGESQVWVAFVYQSDHNTLLEGAYIDDVLLTVDTGTVTDEGRTYTTDDDFAEGVMVGVESDSDTLALSDDWGAFPYVWVPNTGSGTVSKVDAEDGAEIARYRTGPDDTADPGGVAVDQEGACWIGNRVAGTVVKIGLMENGGCVDRDGDGEITTSSDDDGNGDITGNELLAWGEDECVLFEVVLVDGDEGVHTPGDDHELYEENQLQAVAVDASGNVWAGVYDSQLLYLLDGITGDILGQIDLDSEATSPTSAVVGADGTVWLTSWPDSWVLGVDPDSEETTRVDLPHQSSGVAVDTAGDLIVTGSENQAFSKVDGETLEVEWTVPAGWLADGVATTEGGQIWVAAPGDASVTRYSRQGATGPWVNIPNGPTGVAVDQDGKLWVATAVAETIYRYDSDSAAFELAKDLVASGGHNAVGDLTGVVSRNLTSRFGTWTVVHDSLVAGTPWGRLSWTADTPVGTAVRVRVRSSEDESDWSAWEAAADGVNLSATPDGRYLEIQVTLQVISGDDLPDLEELTVEPGQTPTPPVASFEWTPPTPTVGQLISFTDTSTGDPTSWAWDFGDGETSVEQNPTHAFASEGEFQVSLSVENDDGSDTVSNTFTVGPSSGCVPTCSATAPATAELNEQVDFAGDVEAPGCSGEAAVVWDFGDGSTSGEINPSHVYRTLGTLRWQMTVTVDDAACTAAGDITVSGAGPDECVFTTWVPVVSRDTGTSGSVWRSDLGLLGVDPAGAAAELRFHGSDPVSTRVVTVVPGAMVNLVDVVDWIAPGFEGSGSLEICSDGELRVDSRTYNLLGEDHDCFPAGTFGQYLAGQSPDAGLAEGGSAWLGQLRESEAFRTNIGLVNMGSEAATVKVELFDATGAALVEYELELDGGAWRQDNRPFFKRAGRNDLDAASAKLTVVSGDGIVAYASVIDNLTSDATTIPLR
ncbi:MAG: PKD domain-containing protein [Thermoanaerobaculales bacterium]|jgi:PKD repeat protein|nr:PKD domain-containing protein [Thermoanaerobaculales bacterium]